MRRIHTPDRPSLVRIGLLSASLGKGNLGDEATVAAVIQNIRRRHRGVSLYVLSGNPDDTRQRHRVAALPVTRHAGGNVLATGGRADVVAKRRRGGGLRERVKAALKARPMIYRIVKGTRAVPDLILGFFAELKCLVASLRYLRGTDLLFVTGSGVLSDHFGGPANFPYTFFKWAVLARVARVPLAFVSVGAGPLQHRPSRRLIRYALKLAAYRSCRDVTSKKILDDLGLPGQTLVFPDLANGLYVEPVAARARDGSPVVGVNVFPHYDLRYSPIGDVGRYQRYLTTLASFVAWLIRQNYRIVLFSTQIRADGLAIRDFKELLKTSHGADMEGLVLEFRINDVADLTYCLATMDLVVATRFHGILLSLLMNRPVLALSNHHKMTDLMIDVGQGAYVFDIATMCAESLVERFKDLESNSGKVRREISERMGGYRRALEEQYDVVLGLADGARSVRNCSAGRAPVRPPVVDGNGGPGLYYPGAGGS